VAANPSHAQNNPICMPHAGSDDTLEAAPIGGYARRHQPLGHAP
jgi:hypothetical protein